MSAPAPGSIGWLDLTVEDAPRLRDFYSAVAGWKGRAVPRGEAAELGFYEGEAGEPRAGICHARGTNEGLPPVWLVYVVVADLDASLSSATALGGEVLVGPKATGRDRYAVLRDPAGASFALWQKGA
ncbi:MAG: VOC family protein [Thermoanaerobaculia bacterium]|nr:VOC family protein [Thermoanaerobaculia bacterium]